VPPFVGAAPVVPASLPSDLLRRRPDVRSAEAELAGAVGRKNLARLAFLPTFTLKPGYGWSKSAQMGATDTISSTWNIGGAVTQPIFDIPNLLAQLKIYDARTQAAAAAYEKAIQTAFGESEGALVRLDADRRRVELLTTGEARALRAYKAALKGYQLGLNDLDTTLSSEQGWRSVRIQLTSAQVQAVRQAVTAYKALGGGWTVGDPPSKPLAANPRAAAPRAE
jgi:multidrug efflux system outer membrane protein